MKTRIHLISLLILLVNILLNNVTYAQSEDTKAEIRKNIDWMVNDAGYGAPAQLWVWNYWVPVADGLSVPRGPISAPYCVFYGVLFALAGQDHFALDWLQAGQAHNSDVVQLFEDYPEYTVEYAVKKYRNQALVAGGLSATLSSIPFHYIVALLNGHRPAPKVASTHKDPYEESGRGKPSIRH